MTALTGYFGSHLEEMRRRVLISFVAIFVATVVAYVFSDNIARFFMAPLTKAQPDLAKLVYTNLTEAFVSYLKVSLLVGLAASFPILCLQLWLFIAPGLHKHEKRFAIQVVFWGTALFGGGVAFAYFVVMPEILSFLLSFVDDQLTPLPKLDSYLTFVARTSLTFGLAFEIPFLMVMAAKAGLVGQTYFKAKRKYYYIAIVVLSFLLTVGDILSAVLLALPLFCLYEAGIFFSKLFGKKKEK